MPAALPRINILSRINMLKARPWFTFLSVCPSVRPYVRCSHCI